MASFTPSGSLAHANCLSASARSSSLASLAAHFRQSGICSGFGLTKMAFFFSSPCSMESLSASCLPPISMNAAKPPTASKPTKIAIGAKRPFLKLPSPESKPAGTPPPPRGAAGMSSSGGHLAKFTIGGGGRLGAGEFGAGNFESSMNPPAKRGDGERTCHRRASQAALQLAAHLAQAEKRGESSLHRSSIVRRLMVRISLETSLETSIFATARPLNRKSALRYSASAPDRHLPAPA